MSASPAFQFYPADYTIGTKFLTPAERGVYIDCLCHQWDEGSIPGDNIRDLSVVMRCSEREAKALWVRVSSKFTRGDDGLWRNVRLESEREKQAAYRRQQAENGRRSAEAKAQRKVNGGSTIVATVVTSPLELTTNQQVNQPSTLLSSSSSSSSKAPSKNDGAVVRGGGNVMSPLDFEKLQRNHAYVGVRLRVPHKLHTDFIALLGGDEPDAKLRAWYATVDEEIERTRETITPNVWKWLTARYDAWAEGTAVDPGWAEIERWAREGDAADAAAKAARRG